jgi:cystathionine beta-lyase/cystathionine gamma-synthase
MSESVVAVEDRARPRAPTVAPHFFELKTPRALRNTRTGVGSGAHLYARYGTPSNTALETALAHHFAKTWVATAASGMAATDLAVSAAIRACGRSTPVIGVFEDLYVGSRRYFERILPGYRNIGYQLVPSDPHRPEIVVDALERIRPDIVFAESITNPLLFDLNTTALRDHKKRHKCLVIVDDTLRCSAEYTSLSGVADMIVHSATKYICARNDTMAGIVMGDDPALFESVFEYRKFVGCLLPDCSGLRLIEDIVNLAARFEAQRANAKRVAQFIQQHKAAQTSWVNERATLVTFEISPLQLTGEATSDRFFEAGMHGLPFAASFGSSETTATPLDLLDSRFSGRPMIRISCGSEDIGIILSKLRRSFAALRGD